MAHAPVYPFLYFQNDLGQIADMFIIQHNITQQQFSFISLCPYHKVSDADGSIKKHQILGCQIVLFDDSVFRIVIPEQVVGKVCLIHNCKPPICGPSDWRFVCNSSSRTNQEYLVNRFRLKHTCDYFE